MKQEFLVVPNTNERVYDGTVVMLKRLPGLKWVAHLGYYMYNGVKRQGWYLCSVPSQTNMPLFPNDLVDITILNNDAPLPPFPPKPPFPPFPPCPPCPPFPPCPPCPPGPEIVQYTKADKLMVDRSMITVPSLEERDKLSSDDLVDGKVVRVNDFEGNIEYFEWDAENRVWNLLNLGQRYLTREEIEDTYATAESVTELSETVEEHSNSIDALNQLTESHSSDLESLHNEVSDITENVATISGKLDDEIEKVSNIEEITETMMADIDTLVSDVSNIDNSITQIETNITNIDASISEIQSEVADIPQWVFVNRNV